jgi:IS5 family transposase
MSRKDYSQNSFADYLTSPNTGKKNRLAELDGLLDWSRLDALMADLCASRRGRPGYPPLVMLKALLLAQWYNLSDPALEEALADRVSFRRFCGLPLEAGTPDETSFVRFRNRLREAGLMQPLFEEVNRQFDAKGLMLKKGALVDATIVAADAKRPAQKEGEVSSVDPDAGFTRKNDQSHFGYKMHIGVDEGSGLLRRVLGSSADLHDGEAFCECVVGDEAKAYADKAYASEKNREALREAGIGDRIMRKAARNRPLKPWEKAFNRAVSAVRAAVERPFAVMKRCYGLTRARYRGLARNHDHFHAVAIAYNMRRALTLTAATA